ncbi:prepilin-type N-terminal cleavage/methylation domain-containing protein [Blastopirellula sp. JC732]|uniref:Prepilin-type N-terminal cleavage/methylation domain-containing protein n=1 Tax=Blastopirellula sediminis TaxID=2894196 RepID=A0A9X1SJM3_9BACT|nr:prepilin-type N-terminal cleavage/methylation domain-containing protein [Blastopirellula sediminis]MCC9604545.1 prepilin-type N-terminal cleavage/methylation domain-containing protein [Blastopirellula sediminis]MCC9632156.1 prepilin-type N-terminal cleavage/methylation domain-containing protein [Blastopirellula sediminis]
MRLRTRLPRRGFSLIEALICLTVITITSAALLLSVESTLEATMDAQEMTIASGLADQMLDEALGQDWVDPTMSDPYPTSLSASTAEASAAGRSEYDDTDDYNDYTSTPPTSIDGITLGQSDGAGRYLPASFQMSGSFLQRWRCKCEVYYVDKNDLSLELDDSNSGPYRAIEATVFHLDGTTWREVLTRRRVFTYVPPTT